MSIIKTTRRRGLALAAALTALAIATILSGCRDRGTDPLTVTVSFAPMEWIVRNIAGDDFKVNTLVGKGTDPETFDPSVSDLAETGRSARWLTLGTPGLERSLERRVRENCPGLEIVDCGKGIEKITGTHGDGHEADPHLWSSVRNMRVIASRVLPELVELNPSGRERYDKAFRRLDRRLAELDDSVRRVIDSGKGRTFAIMHPSLSYFARDYGLRQIAFESEGKETTPRQMRERIDRARRERPAVMFLEAGHAPGQAREIASQTGTEVREINLNSADWDREILRVADGFRK